MRSIFPNAEPSGEDKPEPPAHDRFPGTQYADSTLDNSYEVDPQGKVADPDLVNLAKKEIRVIECWRKHYKKLYQVIHLGDEFFQTAFGWSDKQVKQAATIEGLRILPRKTHRWRVTTIAANILLSDVYAQDDPENPDLIVAYSKRRRGRWWSVIHKLKDPQRELDKRHSQFIDALNTMAGRVWFWAPWLADSFGGQELGVELQWAPTRPLAPEPTSGPPSVHSRSRRRSRAGRRACRRIRRRDGREHPENRTWFGAGNGTKTTGQTVARW